MKKKKRYHVHKFHLEIKNKKHNSFRRKKKNYIFSKYNEGDLIYAINKNNHRILSNISNRKELNLCNIFLN